MGNQVLVLQQLLNGGGSGWVQATLLACLVLILLLRPERIERRGLFFLACWLYVSSMLIPPLAGLLMWAFGGVLAMGRPGYGGLDLFSMATLSLGPLLFGASILLTLLSLLPRPVRETYQPPKHPLE